MRMIIMIRRGTWDERKVWEREKKNRGGNTDVIYFSPRQLICKVPLPSLCLYNTHTYPSIHGSLKCAWQLRRYIYVYKIKRNTLLHLQHIFVYIHSLAFGCIFTCGFVITSQSQVRAFSESIIPEASECYNYFISFSLIILFYHSINHSICYS